MSIHISVNSRRSLRKKSECRPELMINEPANTANDSQNRSILIFLHMIAMQKPATMISPIKRQNKAVGVFWLRE